MRKQKKIILGSLLSSAVMMCATAASASFMTSCNVQQQKSVPTCEFTQTAEVKLPEIGLTGLAVDQGFLTAGKGNSDHILLRINLERDLEKEALPLTGVKFNLQGTTNLNDISALRVYATQDPYLNGDKKAFARLLAETTDKAQITASGDISMTFNSEYIPLGRRGYLWVTADIAKEAVPGNSIDASLICVGGENGAFYNVPEGNPKGMACIYEKQTMLFSPWDNGSEFYRIPAMLTLENESHGKKGRILTVTDRRFRYNSDLPNNIDLVAKHSDDNGSTWTKGITIAGLYADSINNQGPDYGYGDAALVETNSGKVICMMAADRQFQPSTYEEENRIKMYVASSADGGDTWQKPHEISNFIYDAVYNGAPSKLQGVFVTSGKGLCLKNQKDSSLNGRILFVMVCKFTSGLYQNYIVYSDDEGATWKVSDTKAYDGGDEAKLVEESDGTVIMSTRRSGERGFSSSRDGGNTWENPYMQKELWGNSCNADMLVYSDDLYIHTMPNAADRRNLTIYASKDKGKTWPYKFVINELPAAYSTLVKCADGKIGVYYEDGTMSDHYSMNFLTIPVEWIVK